jgi:hypothetical protein
MGTPPEGLHTTKAGGATATANPGVHGSEGRSDASNGPSSGVTRRPIGRVYVGGHARVPHLPAGVRRPVLGLRAASSGRLRLDRVRAARGGHLGRNRAGTDHSPDDRGRRRPGGGSTRGGRSSAGARGTRRPCAHSGSGGIGGRCRARRGGNGSVHLPRRPPSSIAPLGLGRHRHRSGGAADPELGIGRACPARPRSCPCRRERHGRGGRRPAGQEAGTVVGCQHGPCRASPPRRRPEGPRRPPPAPPLSHDGHSSVRLSPGADQPSPPIDAAAHTAAAAAEAAPAEAAAEARAGTNQAYAAPAGEA